MVTRLRLLTSVVAVYQFLLVCSSGAAAILHVGAGQPHTTITGAMAAASNGDTLRIHDGLYSGGLFVNKQLTFEAVNVGGVIIDGGGFGPDDAVIRVAADSTYIGLQLQNSRNGLYQRDSGANVIAQRLIITDVTTGLGINNSASTSGSVDATHLTIDNVSDAVNINDGGTINLTNSIISNVSAAYTATNNIALNPSHNLLFNFVSLTAGPGTIGVDPSQLVGDPLYLSPGVNYRLGSGSPAIDSGIDVGLGFFGAAPDRGAFEFTAVPEPSSLLLLALGSLGCVVPRKSKLA